MRVKEQMFHSLSVVKVIAYLNCIPSMKITERFAQLEITVQCLHITYLLSHLFLSGKKILIVALKCRNESYRNSETNHLMQKAEGISKVQEAFQKR